jgi:hypothetical protein
MNATTSASTPATAPAAATTTGSTTSAATVARLPIDHGKAVQPDVVVLEPHRPAGCNGPFNARARYPPTVNSAGAKRCASGQISESGLILSPGAPKPSAHNLRTVEPCCAPIALIFYGDSRGGGLARRGLPLDKASRGECCRCRV